MTMTAGIVATSTAALAQEALIAGHVEVGATVFKQCMACHQLGTSARNGIGPVLNGVVGRPAGIYPGYSYSSANKNSGLVWDEQTLTRYLRAPAELVPGTKMIFFGLKKSQDVADVIAYLKQFDADGKQIDRRETHANIRAESN
jgi:cytochrome c